MVVINERSYWFDALKELNINIIGIKKGTPIYNNVIWEDEANKPTEAVILAKIQDIKNNEPFKVLRNDRNKKLFDTDYRTVHDYPYANDTVKQAWLTYRQALRDLPANSTPQLDANGNLTNVTWPTPPS